ncbi:PREDICTED: putative FBD-associated F-box protein At5g56560 [Camelina sativa]|uniref:FBD-associated F-box protein At5g56560 n=1 Tax=Camelina sativa TaxID=90675 RepID=A0ABM0WVJ9_CAMSA|nr:PREDICTED: putative FBD-associated F-box protein At5g56560 [Camelina sativa]
MESIDELPDELLVKILASLPMFKETVATTLISKRWRDLWKLVPDLKFDDTSFESTGETFISFVHTSLVLKNQTIERLHLKLSRNYLASIINHLVQAVVDRSVRVVRLDLSGKTLKLPSCLSTCRTLETLILCETSIEGVQQSFCLPSLKTLHLSSVKFSGYQSVASLLQICPVLEDLVFSADINVASLLEICPVLKDLVVHRTKVFNVEVFKLSTWVTLKSLKLRDLCMEIFPYRLYLASLKTLHLISVQFTVDKYVVSLLQICPVLEHLVVDQTSTAVFNMNVPSLIAYGTLKTLILRGLGIQVVPQRFHLPSLNTLHLISVRLLGGVTVASLLTRCPVLECLIVSETNENVMISNIDVPTLRNLYIKTLTMDDWKETHEKRTYYVAGSHGFVIKAPLLTELNFEDTISNFLVFESMPQVIKANIEVIYHQSENFIGSLTSVRHLSLCTLASMTPYPKGTSLSSLKHPELCTCSEGWPNQLVCMLNDAPKVRYLKLKSKHSASDSELMNLWKKTKAVPKCLSKHLDLEWKQYEGTEQQSSVAEYILANASCLKTATFSLSCRNRKYRKIKKLKSMGRVSKTCQLVFD